MRHLKRFLRQDRDYFQNNAEAIQMQNAKILKISAFLYLLILATYTTQTLVAKTSATLLTMYYIFDVIHVALCVVLLKCGKKEDNATCIRYCRICFELSVLLFFVLEATIPFPGQYSIYFPFPIILLLMLFAYRAGYALTLILSYTAVFVTLGLLYKEPAAFVGDLYITFGTLISALIGYTITATLRHDASATAGRLRYLSMTDTLTRLHNKETFESLCSSYIESADDTRGYAILFVDVDQFKQINDKFGHQIGDEALREIATVMREVFYEKDFLCRFGGDEFVIFMVDVKNEAAVRERASLFRERVLALAEELHIDALSCSVGIAMRSKEKESYAQLLARADAALYMAKKSGRQQITFAESTQFAKDVAITQSEEEHGDGLARRKVLVVDDNKVNRQILKKILCFSYTVLEAENGAEAIQILERMHTCVSAVLLDIVMPVMDGYEVLGRMRRDPALSKIPVIVTTGSAEDETEAKALSLGANDFVIKPYRPAIIMHRLQNTIKLRETAAIVNAVERDELTGLYSKEFFYEKVEQIIAGNPDEKFDIICCDIERFKVINELFGQRAADGLLKYLSELLMEEMCGQGLHGRVGADQIASLMPHKEVYTNADFEAGNLLINQYPISINIAVKHGIYCVDDTTLPASTMCDRALTACNAIKGKYGVYFMHYDDTFMQKTLYEQFILDGMKAGLEQRQFKVYYQPKCELATEHTVGAEALVRWQHPEKGMLSPAEFLPLFESNGFITDLDIYVWETVCSDMHDRLSHKNVVLPISVNVSRADLYNPQLPDILNGLVEKYELQPECLHLEITETAYTADSEQLITAVNRLRHLGFVIEMDDFGSGYSSLNMLSELPINILKLDMRFLSGGDTSRKKNILKVIAYLSKELGLPIVAEGVETAEQVQMLRHLGCHYAQGYYFAKPMPHAEFEKYLQKSPVNSV